MQDLVSVIYDDTGSALAAIAGRAAVRSRKGRTTQPSDWQAIPPRPPSSHAAATSSARSGGSSPRGHAPCDGPGTPNAAFTSSVLMYHRMKAGMSAIASPTPDPVNWKNARTASKMAKPAMI